MRVLLTGAAGFIGAHVHRALVAAGHDVVAVDALLEAVHGTNAAPPQDVSSIDIRAAEALEPLLRGVDVVCHLAAAVPVDVVSDGVRGETVGPRGADPIYVVGPPALGRAGAGASGDGAAGSSASRRASAEMLDDGAAGFSVSRRAASDGEGVNLHRDTESAAQDEGAKSAFHGEGIDEARPLSGPATRPVVRHSEGDGSSGPAVGGGRRPGVDGPTMSVGPMFAAHNDFGTAVLLAAMERAGVPRLVLGSSVAVYGEGRYRGLRGGPFFPGLRRRADLDRGMFDHRLPRTGEILTWEPAGEDAPLRPRTAYAASKLAQENYALAWGMTTGGAVTVLRYHHVYGDPVGGNATLAAHSGVVARFRRELESGRAPLVFEDGGQVRDFVHVRDVAAATVAAVERPLPGFVPLNISSGHPVTLWEVASIMSRARGGPEPVVSGRYRTTDIRHIVAAPDRAHHALDFTPRVPPAQGLTDYARKSANQTRP